MKDTHARDKRAHAKYTQRLAKRTNSKYIYTTLGKLIPLATMLAELIKAYITRKEK